jgi:hypothetical protein
MCPTKIRSQEHSQYDDYTHLITIEGDEYHSATAKTATEVCKLVDAGFEHVCDVDGLKVFRKRK